MLRILTAATEEPVSLAEAKLHVRADGTEFDSILPGLISAAREIVEQQTGYALAEASYEWTPVCPGGDPPILPATVTSGAGVTPILFTTTPGPLPAALRAAILLLVADMLVNTEANSDKPLTPNQTVQSLIFPYRSVLP